MTVPVATLRPNADVNIGAWTDVGGTGSVSAALTDGAMGSPTDSTYGQQVTDFTDARLALQDGPTFADTDRIRSVRIRARVRRDNNSRILAFTYMDGVLATSPDVMYPTAQSAYQDFDGQWRVQIPGGGRKWLTSDIKRLQVRLNPAAYPGSNIPNPSMRVSTLQVEVLYAQAPVVAVVAPGTQNVAKPTLTITYSQSDGIALDQTRWRVARLADVTAAGGGFSPDTFDAWVYSADVAGSGLEHVLTSDLTPGTFVVYVSGADSVDGAPHWSAWGAGFLTIQFDGPSAPIINARPQSDFGRTVIEVIDTGNLLTQQDADFEDSTRAVGSWIGAFSNATLARTTAAAQHGSAALELTAIAAGDASMFTSYMVRAVAGDSMMLTAQVRAVATGRNVEVGWQWYDEFGIAVGSTTTAAAGSDVTGSWSTCSTLTTVPAGVAFGIPVVKIKGCAAGEKHRIDAIKANAGFAAWSRGGLSLRNLLTEQASSIESASGGTGWMVAAGYSCTQARSTTVAAHGAACLAVTATAAADVGVTTDALYPVREGLEYTFSAKVRTAVTARNRQVFIQWFDETLTQIGQAASNPGLDTLSFLVDYVTAVAPPGAVAARLAVFWYGCANTEVHYLDAAMFSRDPRAVVWQPGPILTTTSQVVVNFTDTPEKSSSWTPILAVGTLATDPVTNRVYVHDHFCPPDQPRSYQAQILAVENAIPLAGDASGIVTSQCPVDVFWLKDPEDPDASIAGLWVFGPIVETIPERYGAFTPLPSGKEGDDGVKAVIVSGGTAGKVATYTLHARDDDAWAALEPLVRTTRPLLLVSPFDGQRWVQITGDRTITTSGTPSSARRDIEVQTIETNAPT